MGNTYLQAQQDSPDLLAEFSETRRENNGLVVTEKKSDATFFLKEHSFENKHLFDLEFKRLQNLQAQPQNENILPLVRLFSQTLNNICANSYKIYALYEYPAVTLEEEIEARRKENKYFEECELWSITQSCANALSELRPTFSLHPRSVFIIPDGVLKVINNEMVDEEYRCIVKEADGVYYAPEKIREFKKNDCENSLRKEAIFSLGMTILHAALLAPVRDCYNYQSCEFHEDKLEKHIEDLVDFRHPDARSSNNNANVQNDAQQQNHQEQREADEQPQGRYSEEFIEMLAMVLEPNPNKRASLMEVHGILNRVWNTETEEQTCENQQQKQQKQIQHISNNDNHHSADSTLRQSENHNNNQKKSNYQCRNSNVLEQRSMNSAAFMAKDDNKIRSSIKQQQQQHQQQQPLQFRDTENSRPEVANSQYRSQVQSYNQSERQSRPNLSEWANRTNVVATGATGFTKAGESVTTHQYPQHYVSPVYSALPSAYTPPSTSSIGFVSSTTLAMPVATTHNHLGRENNSSLYTDPKLLEMIRRDLQDINQLKKSSIMNSGYTAVGVGVGAYGSSMNSIGNISSSNYYGGTYFPSYGDIGGTTSGMYSSKSSMGFVGMGSSNVQQIHTTLTTEHNIPMTTNAANNNSINYSNYSGNLQTEPNVNNSKMAPKNIVQATKAPESTKCQQPPATVQTIDEVRKSEQVVVSQQQKAGQSSKNIISNSSSNYNSSTSSNNSTINNINNVSTKGFSKVTSSAALASSPVLVTEQYEDGRKFEGTMLNGRKHGHGKLTYSDGAYYEGEFKDDKMEGKGTLFYGPGLPAYEGEWREDQFHGFGILHNESPLELKGCFNYSDFHLIEDFWVSYEGFFDCDNKSGEGRLVLSNGEQFQGQFDSDCINGKGVFSTQEGEEVHGIWEDNILVQVDS